ncbi:unnamed protein product [Medioppia subpectinata]|uniref:Rab-GAP TBC domain-containing protein n=1 Tax=Medioppia subpectinata TaxID=1979941 RepID=A0A7R9KZI4_9ACAR|nr:unnamed protein product [Medioppia subpectinata]CAG2112455.1 unnamed protein product [Medioppia subpectinata]
MIMKQMVDHFVDKECHQSDDKTVANGLTTDDGLSAEEEDSDEVFSQIDDQLSDEEVLHMTDVLNCLQRSDTRGLRRLATVGQGFITDNLRRQIWPKVAKVSVVETSPRPDLKTIESHEFYNQVVLDVNRSLKRFPPSIDTDHRISMQDSLVRLIMRVLIKNPELHYFQGYHDICVTFLMVLGEEMAFYVVNQLSKTHFRIFMDKTMEKTADLMDIIPILVRRESEPLGDHMERSDVGTIFALSWVITWFSHVLPTYEHVTRLFDFFLVSHSLMPLYLTVALVLHKERHILDTDCDMPSLHQLLTRIPETEELPIESLIESAVDLMDRHPPSDMIKEQESRKQLRLKLAKSRAKKAVRSDGMNVPPTNANSSVSFRFWCCVISGNT